MEETVQVAGALGPAQAKPAPVGTGSEMKDLLEKNLKWSQIIYEQNRRIKRRLLWLVVGGWVKIFIIVIPLILGVVYLPPLVRTVMRQYGTILVPGGTSAGATQLENILKSLPLQRAEQDQLRRLFK